MYMELMENGSVKALLGSLRLSDEEAYLHSLEVAKIVEACLNELDKMGENEWTREECDQILMGALLHDIGKTFLPFGLQHASKALDKYDRAIIQMHPILGYEAVKNCEFPEIITNIILLHHTHADGTGYPQLDGKCFTEHGENGTTPIPDYVWLVAYADKFEAMTNKRSYKQAKDYPTAWKELLKLIRDDKLAYKYTRVFFRVVTEHSILPIKEELL